MYYWLNKVLLVTIVFTVFFPFKSVAEQQCSAAIGQVTINEVYDASGNSDINFIEVKILTEIISTVDISSYTLSLSNTNIGNVDPMIISLSDAIACTDCPWFYTTENNGNMAKIVFDADGFDMLLLDGDNNIVDYLTVNGYAEQSNNCEFPYPTEAFIDGNGNKIKSIHRIGDGTGDWQQVESNSSQTPGDGNDDSSFPYIVVDDVTVTQGTVATLTVRLEDIPNNFDQIISFNFTTVDGSALADEHYDTVIEAYNLDPDAGQTSLEIEIPTVLIPDQVTREFYGVIFSGSAVNIRDGEATITIDPAETFDHFEISHNGNGSTCTAEFVTIKACKNEACDELYTDELKFDFQVNGITKSTLTMAEGEILTSFSHGYIGDALLAIANPTTPSANGTICDANGVDNCVITFSDAECLSCQTGWQDGATSFGNQDDGVDFGEDTQIINNPDNILAAASVKVDDKSTLLSCEDEHCTAVGEPAGKPVLGSFLETVNPQTEAVVINKGEQGLVGNENVNHYSEIEVLDDGYLNFSNAYSEYRIDTLKLHQTVTLNLAPGDYWIKNFLTKKGNDNLPQDAENLIINVVGDGLVRMFFTGHIDFFDNNRINVGGDPANFWLVSYDQIHIKEKAQIYALMYGEDDFHIKADSILVGAISAEKVKVEEDSQIVYGCDYNPPIEIPDELCDVTFIDGATNHDPLGHITFEEFSQITNNPDTALASVTVNNPDFDLFTDTCETAPCEANGVPSKEFDPGVFKSTNSSLSITINGNGNIGDAGENEFSQVQVNENSTASFTNNYNHYRITTMQIEANSNVVFAAGDYWIDTLVIAEDVTFELQGTVRLFINSDVNFSSGDTLNNLGEPEDLFIFAYNNINLADAPVLTPYKNVEINAHIYSQNDVVIGNRGYINGAIAAANVYASYLSEIDYQCELGVEPPVEPPDLMCAAPFVDGATSFSTISDDKKPNIKFGNNAKILHNPDTVLESITVDSDSDGLSCIEPAFDPSQNADCSASGAAIAPLSLDPFLESESAVDEIVEENTTVVLGPDENQFDFIEVKSNAVLEFSPNTLEYRINELKLKDSATVRFAPGDYWIGSLDTDDTEHHFEIVGEGKVRFFVDGHSDIRDNSTFNDGGNPGDFLIISYDKFHVKKNVAISALIYSVGDFHIESGSVLYGAVSSAKIDLKDNSTIEFSCITGEPPEPVYQIIHDGEGLTCQYEPIVIKACADSSCDMIDNSINTSVVLAVNGDVEATINIVNGVSVNASFTHVEPTTASLSLVGSDYLCQNLGDDNESCDLTFADAGFILDVQDNVSCSSQPVTIKAVKKDESSLQCVGAFTGPKNVNFSFDYSLPNTGTQVPYIDGVAMNAAGVDKSYLLMFDENAEAVINDFSYNDAGRINLRANFTENTGDFEQLYLEGVTNVLHYPAKLVASANKNLPNSPLLDGSEIEKAGIDFNISLSAQCETGEITPNYQPDHNQSIEFKVTRAAPIDPVLGGNGTLSAFNASYLAAINGSFVTAFIEPQAFVEGVTFDDQSSYSEVGLINLEARDSDYSGYVINSASNTIGRFTPHHFKQTIIENGDLGSQCGTFAYTGETIGIANDIGAISYDIAPELLITPYNASGEITKNYIQGFMKLSAQSVSRTSPTVDYQQLGVDDSPLTVVANIEFGEVDPMTEAEQSGQVIYRFSALDNYLYERNLNALIAPFTGQLEVIIDEIVDFDGISARNTNDNGEEINNVEHPVAGQIDIKFGRWFIHDTFGPEDAEIQQIAQVEHFDGTKFIINTEDNCTIYDIEQFVLSELDSLTPSDVAKFDTEPTNSTFKNGEVLSIMLDSIDDETGQIGVTYEVPQWLKFGWQDNSMLDENPFGIATFGVFDQTGDRVIGEKEIDK
ncbi:DUF6701 domain-containing protein [Thalassotalea crassostreae]|uniref:DUF6701 domain-containing protein n=1 Tax=Thalassotalea crassostreae TaxID=1763536 RepID=UPI00083888DE|nr:DUF6701 domain-containing protein [Thalassotalea crassostreae]